MAQRLWRCEDPDCDNKSWSEQAGAIAPQASLTRRARVNICVGVGRDGHSIAVVAAHYGVGWATAMGAVLEHGAPLVDGAGRIGWPISPTCSWWLIRSTSWSLANRALDKVGPSAERDPRTSWPQP